MPYTTVLFDLDHTLFDSDTSEALAYRTTMEAYGLEDPDRHFPTYDAINMELWAGVERGTVSPNDVRFLRFERFAAEIGLDADPRAMAETFVEGMGSLGELYPGAREALDHAAAHAALGLVTNGIGVIQRARIERVGIAGHFEAVVISGEVGVSKPSAAIFDLAFAGLGEPDRSAAVMIGDSLSSDMAGAANAGVAACWYNRHGAPPPPSPPLDHVITELGQVPGVVSGRSG